MDTQDGEVARVAAGVHYGSVNVGLGAGRIEIKVSKQVLPFRTECRLTQQAPAGVHHGRVAFLL